MKTEEGTNHTQTAHVGVGEEEVKNPTVITPRLFLAVRESSKAGKEDELGRGMWLCLCVKFSEKFWQKGGYTVEQETWQEPWLFS